MTTTLLNSGPIHYPLLNHPYPSYLLQLHAAILRFRYHQHLILNFKLQCSYSSFHLPFCSLSLFLHYAPDDNVFFFSTAIHSLSLHILHFHFLSLYSLMLPNAFTLSSVLKVSLLNIGHAIHAHYVKLSVHSGPYVATTLLDMYACSCDIESTRGVFDGMPVIERKVITLTTMVTCYVKVGDLESVHAIRGDGLHKKLELSEKIADFLVNNDHANSGICKGHEKDYHTATKLIKKITGWKIVVRDMN